MSLLEVILAASLVGLIFIFLLNIFPAAMMGVRQSEHRVAAQAQAQRLLDGASAGGYDRLATDGQYTSAAPGPFGTDLDDVKLEDGQVLTSEVTVSGVGSIPRARLARVRVLVAWKERDRPQELHVEKQISALRR